MGSHWDPWGPMGVHRCVVASFGTACRSLFGLLDCLLEGAQGGVLVHEDAIELLGRFDSGAVFPSSLSSQTQPWSLEKEEPAIGGELSKSWEN